MVLDEKFLFMAFRYALGRSTYVVSEVVEVVIEKWDEIPKDHQYMINKEIIIAIELGRAGMDMDVKEWEKILKL